MEKFVFLRQFAVQLCRAPRNIMRRDCGFKTYRRYLCIAVFLQKFVQLIRTESTENHHFCRNILAAVNRHCGHKAFDSRKCAYLFAVLIFVYRDRLDSHAAAERFYQCRLAGIYIKEKNFFVI